METIRDIIGELSQFEANDLPLVRLIIRLGEAVDFETAENKRMIEETKTELSNLEVEFPNPQRGR